MNISNQRNHQQPLFFGWKILFCAVCKEWRIFIRHMLRYTSLALLLLCQQAGSWAESGRKVEGFKCRCMSCLKNGKQWNFCWCLLRLNMVLIGDFGHIMTFIAHTNDPMKFSIGLQTSNEGNPNDFVDCILHALLVIKVFGTLPCFKEPTQYLYIIISFFPTGT